MYTVMIVDENEAELNIIRKALERTYMVIGISNSKTALQRLNKANIVPDLVILDIAMRGIDGLDMITRIKTSEKLKNIPVVFISGDKESQTEIEAYKLGAVDYIRKPIVGEIIKRRIDLQTDVFEYKKNMDSYNNQLQQNVSLQARNAMNLEYFIIGIITDLLAQKDPYTGMHSLCVSKYMEILLKEMLMSGVNYGIDPNDFELILLSSRLHDMGKIGVPDAVLSKVGKYTPEEFDTMKAHTTMAANAIQKYGYLLPNSRFLYYTYTMARYHHERFDGNGYPDRLAGANIPVLARILAVADVYDALVSERSYKKAKTHEEAYKIITQGAGVHYDPQVVAAFQRAHNDMYEVAQAMKQQLAAQQVMAQQAAQQMGIAQSVKPTQQ